MLFRDDDVSNDSNISQLRQIRQIFEDRGLREHYSVTPFGNTEVLKDRKDIASLSYDFINTLTGDEPLKGKAVDFLMESVLRGHSIILHGHTHSKVSLLQKKQIYDLVKEGKEFLEDKFGVEIKYYAPPFNMTSEWLYEECEKLGLQVIHNNGDQLERFVLEDKPPSAIFAWYHYWRFFRDPLSPNKLAAWLDKYKEIL